MNSPIKLPDVPDRILAMATLWMPQELREAILAYAEQAVRDALAAQSEWMPIETALVAEKDFLEDVVRCLVYGPQIGVQVGRAWRYPDGTVRAQAFGFHGDWEITHWQPLPAPPKENNHGDTP